MKQPSLIHTPRALGLSFLMLALSLSLLFAQALSAQARSGSLSPPLPVAEAFRMTASVDGDGSRLLSWDIAEGYYLYREFFKVETSDGKAVAITTQPGVTKDDPTFGSVEIYYDEAQVAFAAVEGPLVVTYQGCQDYGICYPPVQETLSAVEVAAQVPATAEAPPQLKLAGDEGMLEGLQARGGAALVLAGFLFFGLLLAFTPCMFPMYPILAGLLTRQGTELTARRGAALSGVYVLAMASAFGLLGVAAAWSGQNLQMVLQSPAALYTVAAIFALLALSSFGAFELQLPAAWTSKLSGVGTGSRGTFTGAAALGFTSALIMGPCVTAPLAGALLYIAGTGNVALGAGALFALGVGQGIPLLIAGTLGPRVLPKAGAWMHRVKPVFGFVFLAMAIWLVGRINPGAGILTAWSVLLIAAGVFAGAFDSLSPESGAWARLGKTAGIAALIFGALMAVGAAMGGSDPLRPLAMPAQSNAAPQAQGAKSSFAEVTDSIALSAALRSAKGRPALIYVTADWCVTCKVIEREVWNDPAVQTALQDVASIAVDLSDFGPQGQEMLDQLGAVGPPTMVFLNRSGEEAATTRIVGDTTAVRVLASLESIR